MTLLDWLHRKLTNDLDLRVTPAPHAPTEPNKTVNEGAARPLAVGEEPPAPYAPNYAAIANRFTYHAPTPAQTTQYKVIRRQAKELGFLIEAYCPDSEEKSTALIRLDEAVMHANAAIARNS